MSEKAFTKQVLDLAKMYGWRVAHFHAMLGKGDRWITPVQGDGKGFPDLILLKGGEMHVVELKMPGNKPTAEQDEWLEAFRAVGASVWVCYPKDLETLVAVLRGR